MNIDLQGRDFLKEVDFTAAEFTYLLDLASELKHAKRNGSETRRLSGVNLALIFEKTSTRTRCAFEVAAFDQGAHVTFLDPQSSQLGHKESIADTAKVLSRFYDGIEFRGSAHETVEQLAAAADVPVFNGLTDRWQYGILGGFESTLWNAITRADGHNLNALGKGFPDEVNGYKKYTSEAGWFEGVRNKAFNQLN